MPWGEASDAAWLTDSAGYMRVGLYPPDPEPSVARQRQQLRVGGPDFVLRQACKTGRESAYCVVPSEKPRRGVIRPRHDTRK